MHKLGSFILPVLATGVLHGAIVLHPSVTDDGSVVVRASGLDDGSRVAFYDGVQPLGIANGQGGEARLAVSPLTGGRHELRAIELSSDGRVIGKSWVRFDAPARAPLATEFTEQIGNISGAGALVTADWNSDGLADLAVASSSGEISIYLQVKEGNFALAGSYGAGEAVSTMVAGHILSGLSPDLIVLTATGSLRVFPANGDGSFGAVQSIGAGVNDIRSFVLGDLDENGWLDFALTTRAGRLSLLSGSRDGFVFSNLGVAESASGLTLLDANGDGHADVAYVSSGQVNLLTGRGDGTFDSLRTAGAPSTIVQLVPAANGRDLFGLDSDGQIAVFALNADALTLQSRFAATARLLTGGDFLGDGSNSVTFLSRDNHASLFSVVDGSPRTNSLAADLSATGMAFVPGRRPSLVLTDATSGSVTRLVEASGGSRPTSHRGSPSTFALAASSLTTAAAVAGPNATSVYLTVASPNATFGAAITLTAAVSPPNATGKISFYDGPSVVGISPVGAGRASVTTALLSAGTHLLTARYSGDSVNASSLSNPVSLKINAVAGTGYSIFTPYAAGAQPGWIIAADFNNDGKADVAYTTATGVGIALGNGNGTLANPNNYAVTSFPGAVIAADFNGDGKLDLAVTAADGARILLGLGNGTFQVTSQLFATGSFSLGLVAGDFNNDGIVDIAVANDLSNNVSILIGKGDGTFQTAVNYATGDGPGAVVIADFNNDGKGDLAVVNTNASTVSILLGNGNGTFLPRTDVAVGNTPVDIALADLNGDGKVDLVTADGADSTISVLRSSGDGKFTRTFYAVPNKPASVIASDFNGDGNLDVAAANYFGNSVVVLNGNGTGGLNSNSPASYASGIGTTYVAIADFNGDGEADLAVANSGDALGNNSNIGILVSASCYFTATPTSLSFDKRSASASVQVDALTASCGWSAAPDSPWISVSPASGKGAGSFSITIAQNDTGVERNGTIAVAGVNIAVKQWSTLPKFNDVPTTAYYFDAANLMSARGITTGCNPTPNALYCPDQAALRSEMAVFLVRAVMGGDTFSYNPVPHFADVAPSDWSFKWVQKLYELKITVGCGAGLFCPNAAVTRDQMAAFIVRARLGPSAVYYAPATPYFSDVPPSYWGFSPIQRLAYEAITTGCTTNQYCPTTVVTRGNMALFIMRGLFNQLLPTPNLPIIQSITPATVARGNSYSVSISGFNTHFAPGTTLLAPIPGVTIRNVTVINSTTISAQFDVGSGATATPQTVRAITGAEEPVLPNGLKIQ
jgi:hypothetical protein